MVRRDISEKEYDVSIHDLAVYLGLSDLDIYDFEEHSNYYKVFTASPSRIRVGQLMEDFVVYQPNKKNKKPKKITGFSNLHKFNDKKEIIVGHVEAMRYAKSHYLYNNFVGSSNVDTIPSEKYTFIYHIHKENFRRG